MDCFYMLAVAYMFLGDYQFSYENYYKAYSVILPGLDSDTKLQHFSYFFIDMAIALRRMNKHRSIEEKIISLPQDNEKLISKVAQIISLDDADFANYLKHNSRVTPIYDAQYYLNFPKI